MAMDTILIEDTQRRLVEGGYLFLVGRVSFEMHWRMLRILCALPIDGAAVTLLDITVAGDSFSSGDILAGNEPYFRADLCWSAGKYDPSDTAYFVATFPDSFANRDLLEPLIERFTNGDVLKHPDHPWFRLMGPDDEDADTLAGYQVLGGPGGPFFEDARRKVTP
jgi:hypothetical protein